MESINHIIWISEYFNTQCPWLTRRKCYCEARCGDWVVILLAPSHQIGSTNGKSGKIYSIRQGIERSRKRKWIYQQKYSFPTSSGEWGKIYSVRTKHSWKCIWIHVHSNSFSCRQNIWFANHFTNLLSLNGSSGPLDKTFQSWMEN